MNKWLFNQNGLTRTSLLATVTRVSYFVDENVCFFYISMLSLSKQILEAPRGGMCSLDP